MPTEETGAVTGAEEPVMTGSDEGINVEETVGDLAESLRLIEPEKEEALTPEQEAEKAAKEPAEKPAPTALPKDDNKGTATPTKEVAAPGAEERVPDTWRKEAKEAWATTPPAVRAEIAKREADVAKFVADVTPSYNIAKNLQTVLEPYFPVLQKYNVDPIQHLGTLLNAHMTLLFGEPAVKANMFRNLAKQSGVDLAQLAADPNSSGVADTQQLAYIRGLEERLARMEQGMTGVTSTIHEARAAELEQGIMAFAEDETHPFFWELAEAGEIKALIDSGAARTLKDAYELAVYRNPTSRAKQLELDSKAAVDARAKEAATKVTAARKATSANVKSRGSGRTPPVSETIDETIRSTLSDIRNRTH